MQAVLMAMELCWKLVIAAVHGACVGRGVDIVAACDIRCCSKDATFALKEVDMAPNPHRRRCRHLLPSPPTEGEAVQVRQGGEPVEGEGHIALFLAALASGAAAAAISGDEYGHARRLYMRNKVLEMFYHAQDNYMAYAFPHDELKLLTKSFTDSLSELGNLNVLILHTCHRIIMDQH